MAKTLVKVNGADTESSSSYKEKVNAKLKDNGIVVLSLPRSSAVGLLNILQFYATAKFGGDLGVQGKTLKLLLDKTYGV